MYARSFRFNPILAVIFMALFIWLFVWILRGTYRLLSFVTIPLLIITAIINYNIILDYLKGIRKNLEHNSGLGIIQVLMTVFALPFVSAWLFLKALAHRKLSRMEAEHELREKGEYAEFEEIRDFPPKQEEDFILPTPPAPKAAERIVRPGQQQPEDINHYEKLFDAEK